MKDGHLFSGKWLDLLFLHDFTTFFFAHAVWASIQVTPNVQVLPDQLKYQERIIFPRKVPLFLFILHVLSLLQFSYLVEGWRPFLREVTWSIYCFRMILQLFFNMYMLFEPAYKSLPIYRCYLVNCRKNFFFSGKCLDFSLSCTFLSFQFSHLVSLLTKPVPRLTQSIPQDEGWTSFLREVTWPVVLAWFYNLFPTCTCCLSQHTSHPNMQVVPALLRYQEIFFFPGKSFISLIPAFLKLFFHFAGLVSLCTSSKSQEWYPWINWTDLTPRKLVVIRTASIMEIFLLF